MAGSIEQGQILRAARYRAGLTLRQVADRLGVCLDTVHRWERGAVGVKQHYLAELASLYGVAPGELVPGLTIEPDPFYEIIEQQLN